jgi:hypothetical protein
MIKRFITILTISILLGYIMLLISNISPSVSTTIGFEKAAVKGRSYLGFGALFVKVNSPHGGTATYRLYQNGKWSKTTNLLDPMFNDYCMTGNLAVLRHSRNDYIILIKMNNLAKLKGNAKMQHTKTYRKFINHLVYRHSENIKPDSIEISYYLKEYKTNRLEKTLHIKTKI